MAPEASKSTSNSSYLSIKNGKSIKCSHPTICPIWSIVSEHCTKTCLPLDWYFLNCILSISNDYYESYLWWFFCGSIVILSSVIIVIRGNNHWKSIGIPNQYELRTGVLQLCLISTGPELTLCSVDHCHSQVLLRELTKQFLWYSQ